MNTENITPNTAETKKKPCFLRVLLLSSLAVVLAGGGVTGLLLYLQQDTEPMPVRSIIMEADPEAVPFVKELSRRAGG